MDICTTASAYRTVDQLTNAVYESYLNTREREDSDPVWKKRVFANRKKLAQCIEKFHKISGTLTSTVQQKLDILYSKKDSIFLMTAHQTNFMPYSGVMRKTTLMHAVAEKVEKMAGVDAIEFYGVANQDIASSWPWLKMAQLPSIFHKGGVFEHIYHLEKKYEKKIHAAVPKPSWSDILKWKTDTEQWMKLCMNLIESYGHIITPESKRELYSNYGDFIDIVNSSNESARNFAEFNAIMLSKMVNQHFSHDTLFSLFTDCQQIFDKEFLYLLENRKMYNMYLNNVKGACGVCEIAPFWYHCECLGKVGLEIKEGKDGLELSGRCPACSKMHVFFVNKDTAFKDFAKISKNISARARPMTLVFFEGLAVNMYVGGALAGKCYLKDAKYIADKMHLNFPPIAIWRPKEKYRGFAQLSCELYKESACDGNTLQETVACVDSEINSVNRQMGAIDALIRRATSERERSRLIAEKNSIRRSYDMRALAKKLSSLKKINGAESVIPSIMDYAINIGLGNTCEQWHNYLIDNGSLTEDISLDSILKTKR